MKMKVILLLAIAIAAALVTQPMRATAISTLVITENNSNSLTATLTVGGIITSPIVSGSADNWTIALTGIFGTGQFWFEPDAAGFVNLVSFNPTLPGQLTVRSDIGPRIHGGTSGRHGGHPSTSNSTGAWPLLA